MLETGEGLASFKFIGGALCLDFANTGDLLRDYDALVAWLHLAGELDEGQAGRLRVVMHSDVDQARRAFQRAVSLRKAIHRIFSLRARGDAPAECDVERLSVLVGKSAKYRALRPSPDGFGWRWQGVEEQLDWPAWIIARSAAELLTSDRQNRVRECAAHDCRWLFVDVSRNRSRRWCDMADCGNRAKARRNYSRKRGRSALSAE
ncbi:ABATE domain-containing protein [Candidatus Bipolaricaulota bacterium]|nr:ABATE domain-containing protein [Candidatus Bipolaricaulota bacterium]